MTLVTFRALIPLCTLLVAAAPPPDPRPDPERLRATVSSLVGFGTRHTASSVTDPKRGIGAARDWVAVKFAQLSKSCGGCITVDRPARGSTGRARRRASSSRTCSPYKKGPATRAMS